jgi:hypothetical protein
MRKLVPLLALILALSGCAASEAASAATETPADRKVITGEVVETVGNMVTLKLMAEAEAVIPSEMTDEQRQAMEERIAQRQQITPGAGGPPGQFAPGAEGADPEAATSEAPNQDEGDQAETAPGELQVEDGAVSSGRTRPSGNWTGEEMTEEQRAAFQERMTAGGEGGGFGEMTEEQQAAFQERMTAAGGGNFAEMTDEERQSFFQSSGGFVRGAARSYTGEQADIIIPVGAPIMESSSAGGGTVESEIALENIKSGDILKVTYASDGETVAKVVKQPATASFGGRGARAGASGAEGGAGGFTMPDGAGFAMPGGDFAPPQGP